MTYLGLAWAQVRTRLWAMGAAVVVIALGVGLAAGMLLANHALREGFDRSVEAMAGRADLTMRPIVEGTLDQSLVDSIEQSLGVEAAVPALVAAAVLEGSEESTLQLIGVDLLDDGTMRVYRSAPGAASGVEDPLVLLNQPGSALAPRAFLDRHSLDLGRSLRLRTSSGALEVTIRGVLEDDGIADAFGGGFLIMDLYALQDHLGAAGQASWIDVAVVAGSDPQEVAGRLRRSLPEHIAVETSAERGAEHARTVAGFEAMVNVVAAMGLLLAAVITSNRLATLYQDRAWEIGVLRGNGWSPQGLVRALLGEAALLSILGSLLGLPLGMIFAKLVVGQLAETMTLNFQRTISAAPVEAEPIALVLAAAAGVGSGLLAGWRPARHAARASIAALKSGRRKRDPRSDARWLRAGRIVVPALALVAMVAQGITSSGALGAVAMCLLLGATALLIRPVLNLVSEPIARLSASAQIGLTDQRRAPGRSIGAAAVLSIGLALVVWIANTTLSFESYVSGRMFAHHRSDLIVLSKANHLATNSGTLRVPRALVDELRSIPGVAVVGAEAAALSAAPELGVFAETPARLLDPRLQGLRIEPGAPADALERVARGEAFLIDRLLREQRRLEVGDVLRISTPKGLLERPVAAVSEARFQSPNGNVTLALDLFGEYWREDGVARAYVIAETGVDVAALGRRIEERFGDRFGVRVRDARNHAAWVAENVRQASSFLYAMAVIALLVVLIGTADALAASVIERTREIGILRAIGYRPRSMGGMVLAQSLAIGLTGAALASVLGIGLAIAFVEAVLPALLGWQLALHANYGLVAGAAVLGLLACLAGGALPAVRASHIPVAAAIRYE
jgi:putative ABC transport system permease protein